MANAALAQLLDANLSQGVTYVEETEVVDFGELAGPQMAAERSAFAELLSGSSDKKSRAYKAQRRNVERWVKGRRPMPISRLRIAAGRRQNSARLKAFRLHGGHCRLEVSWYATRRAEWLPPHRWVHLRQPVMRAIIRAWAAEDYDGAADQLFTEFLEQYNVPNVDDWLREVEVVDLRLVPSRSGAV